MSLFDVGRRPVQEDTQDSRLPGGTLMSAILDRRLMGWSDRGGASRHIGDRWAIRCDAFLAEQPGAQWPVPGGEEFTIRAVLRLDHNPEIEREANAYQLENPDFLLLGERDGQAVIQAVDAKFAADRIKVTQVSREVVERLLTVPVVGVTRGLVEELRAQLGLGEPEIARGIFISPASEMTEELLRRVTRGRNATVEAADVLQAPVDPGQIFNGLSMSGLIGTLARIDQLPVTPRNSLLSAVYYFRIACACFYFWNESHRPLLGPLGAAPDPEPGVVAAETSRRAQRAKSAYQLAARWDSDTQEVANVRKAVYDVAALPVTMRELRAEFQAQRLPELPRSLRFVRGTLEREFREQLLTLTGVIEPNDPRRLDDILNNVAAAAKSQRSAVRGRMRALVAAQTDAG